MGIVRPIVDLGTKGDNGGVEGIDGILETELTSGEPNLLLYKKTVFIFLFCWLIR